MFVFHAAIVMGRKLHFDTLYLISITTKILTVKFSEKTKFCLTTTKLTITHIFQNVLHQFLAIDRSTVVSLFGLHFYTYINNYYQLKQRLRVIAGSKTVR